MKKYICSLLILLSSTFFIMSCNINDKNIGKGVNREVEGKEELSEVKNDIKPIYNHFPDLPRTEKIEWCSSSSSGIGLTTVNLYFVAFYDSDVLREEMKKYDVAEDIEDVSVKVKTDKLNLSKIKFRKIKNNNVFQETISGNNKMSTNAYVDFDNGILYVCAQGE